MNKRTIITFIILALVLLGGISALLLSLYKDDGGKSGNMSDKDAVSRFEILSAIPSDAAAVMHFESVKTGVSLLTDRTKAFSAFVNEGKKNAFPAFLTELGSMIESGSASSLKSQSMAMSLHNSGSLVPMLAFQAPKASNDSSLLVMSIKAAADSAGLVASYHQGSGFGVLLVSSSETLVNSSARHMDEGLSIMSNKDFLSAVTESKGRNCLFLSSVYSAKLLQAFFKRPVTKHSEFMKSLSTWVSFSVDSMSEESLQMSGSLSAGRSQDVFAHVLAEQSVESALFPSVAPSESYFVASLPLHSGSTYLESYRKYLDASVTLAKNQAALKALSKSTGVDPDNWVKSLNLKEVAKVQWRPSDDASYEAVMVRVGKKDYSLIFKGLDITSEKEYSPVPVEYAFSGYASSLFGALFAVADEQYFVFTGEWIVSGSKAAVADFAERYAAGDVLQALLTDASVNASSMLKDCTFASYFSPGAVKMDELFSSLMLPSVAATMDGAAFEPCFLTASKDGLHLNVTRVPYLSKSSTPAVVSDAAIEIPQGPFKVKNSGTGETNLLSQQSNFYLSLKEESGKGIWSIPFSEPLCGAVETIDYYVNGKLQFLFAAGSKLYLLDRLGRFVSGFPAELGKEVLLGPSVYDFSGAHGYSVVVLHKDNTIGMYNIHGTKPEAWQGISSDEKIIALPELLKIGGKSYWAVRTAVQTQIFPFNGGEPVYKQSGAKSIRRDSEIEVAGDGVIKATCNDGKTRNIKIQ